MAARGGAKTRGRTAPQPGGIPAPNAVISVELGEDEEVRWIWTHYACSSVVTGYEVFAKREDREGWEV